MDLIQRSELLPYKGDFYLWKYIPSIPAAIIFLLIFLALSVAHTWKMCRLKLWFCIPFVVGGYMEVVGFAGRAAANKATNELMPYIIQSVFLLIPPSLFAASIYMTLGRIIRSLGSQAEACCFVRVHWLTRIFVIGDVFAFLIQASGAGLMAAGDDPKMGEIIVIVGLVIQIIFFGIFVAAAIIFEIRYRQSTGLSAIPAESVSFKILRERSYWEKMLIMLYASSAFILVRCVFRIIEYVMGADAYPLKNEWTLYIFDALLMTGVMVIFYVWYPSDIPAHARGGALTDSVPLSRDSNRKYFDNSAENA